MVSTNCLNCLFAELDQPGKVLDNAMKVKDEPLANRAIIEEDPNAQDSTTKLCETGSMKMTPLMTMTEALTALK